ncbi:MAG TPA: hypothetical protein VMS17_09075 [Gemmataceae bacterium]|nr:hypothetical protein [Gemmataceae bacterium]
MAFIDKDEYGNRFANITHSVGPGKANSRDDVLLVQLLLLLVFQSASKIGTSVDTTKIQEGVYDDATGTMIQEFQKKWLKRPKPQGYVQPALGKKKKPYTIWNLNNVADAVLDYVQDPRDAIGYLSAYYPTLAASLQETAPLTVDGQRRRPEEAEIR